MIAFINGEYIEEDKVTLGIQDLSVHRGYGVFDFFRTNNQIPLFLEDYLNRFFKSAASLRIPLVYSKDELKKIIAELIKQNNLPECGFKMILTGGYSADGFELASPNLIIIPYRIQLPDKGKFDKGLKIILHEYMRDLPQTKSINYLMGVYLQEKVRQHGADDVLYYKNGVISEFPRSNVFIVTKEGTVATPAENVLHGITRLKVLELAAKNYIVEERAITVEELKNASEVFLTSTTKRIIPVVSIDDNIVADGRPGKITTLLSQAFLEMETELTEKRVI